MRGDHPTRPSAGLHGHETRRWSRRQGVPVDDRAEDADGRLRHRLHRLRARAHVRQPQGLQRPRRLQRVRRAPARDRRAAAPARRPALDPARRPDRRARRPRGLRGDPVAPGRHGRGRRSTPSGSTTARRFSRRTMRWGGVDAPAVPRLAPAQLHHRQGQPVGRPDQRPLRPAGRHLRPVVDDAHLPRRHGRARHAPAARRVERRADPRPDQQRAGPPQRQGRRPRCSPSSSPAASPSSRSSRCSE